LFCEQWLWFGKGKLEFEHSILHIFIKIPSKRKGKEESFRVLGFKDDFLKTHFEKLVFKLFSKLFEEANLGLEYCN
jgi:hypothetical protein